MAEAELVIKVVMTVLRARVSVVLHDSLHHNTVSSWTEPNKAGCLQDDQRDFWEKLRYFPIRSGNYQPIRVQTETFSTNEKLPSHFVVTNSNV